MIDFILGTVSRTKIPETCMRDAASNTAQSRHMIANEAPRVSLADSFIDARSFEKPERNPFEHICSRENGKRGCVTTALRIIVKLRSAE
jgi:hypothetical protein